MAWTLKDRNGNCCGCAARVDPCECGTPCASIECRSRGGIAELCGFSEYTDPSTPPKKYRVEVESHEFVRARFSEATCTTRLTGLIRNLDVPTSGSQLLAGTKPGETEESVYSFAFSGTDSTGYPHCGLKASANVSASYVSGPTCGTARFFRRGADISFAVPSLASGNVGTWEALIGLFVSTTFPPDYSTKFAEQVIGSCVITAPPLTDVNTYRTTTRISAANCSSSTEAEGSEGCSDSGNITINAILVPGAQGVASTPTLTQTTKFYGGNGTCVARPNDWGSPTGGRIIAPSITIELSEEDTEAQAGVRLMAGESWGDWATASEACAAAWQARESGFEFVYREAEWRTSLNNPATEGPAAIYTVQVEFWRRPYGVGAYTLFASEEVAVEVAPGATVEVSSDIPNARGYETIAVACRFSTGGGA